VDNGAIRNYMSLKAIERLGLSYKQKKDPYPLIIISGDPILYKDGIIYLKTRPVELEIEGRSIITFFNVLLLGKDKAVLRILFL